MRAATVLEYGYKWWIYEYRGLWGALDGEYILLPLLFPGGLSVGGHFEHGLHLRERSVAPGIVPLERLFRFV